MHYSVEPHPDRRLRALSRPGAPDRREDFRYDVDFPVRVIVGEGGEGREFQGMASDLSDGGVHLAPLPLPEGTHRLHLAFDLPEHAMPEGYGGHHFRLDGEIRQVDAQGGLGIQFEERLGHRLAYHAWLFLRTAAIVLVVAALVLILVIKQQNLYWFWFDVPVFLYSLFVGTYLVSRFVFALLYRPPRATDHKPSMTVVIPTHNEEDHIERTLTDILEARYPADRLRVIVVNDGSTDHTADKIHKMVERYPEITSIHFEQSRGKREALAAGARLSSDELLVFIDSDSFLERDALKRIADAFVDPSVAAVTGHCDVENRDVNTLTRMQAVRYYMGFRIMKAAESLFDSVTCLSGPFAAYRRERVMAHLDDWTGQTFMGQSATFGDDRSLTNFLLQDGRRVLYDSRARCTTMVPERYGEFMTQQLRWKRSWFRESLRACTFIWRRQPFMFLSFYMGFLLPLLAPVVVFRAMLLVPLLHHGAPLLYLSGILLMSMLVSSTYLFARRSRLWIYGFHFCLYYLFVLVWQLPVAVLTFWKPDWGTRKGRI
jgi:hyaluronan synthase